MNNKPKSIFILGRRWFDRMNGNTYHTSQIVVDGKTVHKTPREYGYGNQYEWTAQNWLEANKYIVSERFANGSAESLFQTCAKLGIQCETTVVDLPRRKDL